MTDSPIAGWYPDPQDPAARWRWWSGTDWADETAPRADAPPVRAKDWGWDAPPAREAQPTATATATTARAEPRNANTPWIWVLAFSPYIYGIIAGAVQGVAIPLLAQDASTSQIIGIGGLVVALIPLIVFAELDGRALRKRDLPAPSSLWVVLLAPLIYFVVRGRKLRRVGARSKGPEIALVIVIVVQIVAAIAVGILAASLIAVFLPGSPALG